ncbi:unnamed protein product [Miscanthus lutarioriparius]|uniref:Uncharacterized protein n=1 Tax=Miscanthus lutarioriparius TaxID=422564 RepID=A0A811QW46_9POAL|nr:unnamed protein product [Miscanthus lutarioriparius]
MMPAVGAVVDAAIGWLVQGILGNLFTEKLEAWTQRIGLADDVDKLKSDMRYVQMVAAAAKGRKIENEPLAQSLADLKELLYDAEDVMDDLDYYRLKEQVQSGNTRGGTGTTTACNAATSSTWSSCSIQQHGGTLIRNLSNSISMGGSRGKRKREDDHTIAACTHLNRSEFSRRIKDIRGKLRDLWRDGDKEILDRVSETRLPETDNLDGLQEDLVKRMESKRFLIVLDDVWDDMKQGSWEKLLAPLKRIQTTEMTQTVEPVKLNALEGYALWQMFISCAFGDEKYEEHPSLCTIGKQITKKLRGNPLADMEGIMPALKLSYDYLRTPYSSALEVDRIGSPTGVLPHALIKIFHLEVLDVDPYVGLTLPSDMSNLVSLQHLVGAGEVLSTIASVGNVTSLQELPVFKVQKASGFDIRQLKFMNQLVQLGIYQIENVRSKQEATEARLIDKGHLEELCLLWDSDSTSLETSTETITEVLEVLKPHQNLKHLQISGYSGSVSPSWLEKFWFLRKLKLINICHVQEVRIPCLEELVLSGLPRLEKCMATCTRELDFYLRVLIIENCHELKVFTPFEIQNLCSSEVQQRSQMLSLKGTGSGFSYVEAERNKWLSGLRVLKIHGCPRLMLLHPLPPAENTQVSVQALLTYPTVERMNSNDLSVMSSKELRVLNAKVLEFQNLTDVTSLHIEHCPNLVFLSSEGLRQLLNLRKMAIVSCGNLVSSCIVPNAVSESWKATDHPAFPRLKHLRIESCGGIAGRWLTEMLPHMQSLKELDIEGCPQMKSISIHHPRQEAESSSLACQAVLPTSLGQDEFLLHIPLNVLSTLEKFHIQRCPEMQLYSSSRQGFRGFTSLTELIITGCPMLISSGNERFSVPPSVQYLCIEFLPRRLQPYFPENQSSLRFLSVRESPDLQSLRLHCCTALQEFQIQSCRQVAALEGMQYLSSLRVLSIEMNPELCASWVRRCQDVQQRSGHTRLLPPSLEKLSIRHLQDGLAPYLLAHGTFLFTLVVEDSPNLTSLQLGSLAALRNLQIQDCGSLTSLQGVLPKLEVCFCDSQNLTSLQLGALTALEDLTVYSCDWLTSLETLASLGNLADLAIYECRSIAPLLELLSRQPEGFSVFPRLERLYVDDLSALAMTFFKHLTSLRYLRVTYDSNRNSVRFTDEQEKALQLLTSLQCLAILGFLDLKELPAVLHSLHSLKRLDVRGCPRISRLPEKGLPPSLDVLEINDCSMELQEQCRMLATGKLRVQIYNYHR